MLYLKTYDHCFVSLFPLCNTDAIAITQLASPMGDICLFSSSQLYRQHRVILPVTVGLWAVVIQVKHVMVPTSDVLCIHRHPNTFRQLDLGALSETRCVCVCVRACVRVCVPNGKPKPHVPSVTDAGQVQLPMSTVPRKVVSPARRQGSLTGNRKVVYYAR